MRYAITLTVLLLLLVSCQTDSGVSQTGPGVPEDLKIEKSQDVRGEVVITLEEGGGPYLLILESEKRGGKLFLVGRDCPQLSVLEGDFQTIRAFPLKEGVGVVRKAALVWEPCDDAYCTNPPCPPGG